MRHKYIISKTGKAMDLNIRECAVIGKDWAQTKSLLPAEDDYIIVCEENYKGEAIKISISNGVNDLIAALRTDNMFPNGPLATKIAESVIELYYFSEDCSAELLFDDVELLIEN